MLPGLQDRPGLRVLPDLLDLPELPDPRVPRVPPVLRAGLLVPRALPALRVARPAPLAHKEPPDRQARQEVLDRPDLLGLRGLLALPAPQVLLARLAHQDRPAPRERLPRPPVRPAQQVQLARVRPAPQGQPEFKAPPEILAPRDRLAQLPRLQAPPGRQDQLV